VPGRSYKDTGVGWCRLDLEGIPFSSDLKHLVSMVLRKDFWWPCCYASHSISVGR